MKCYRGLALVALVAGCGDNSKECGPGTADEMGVCTGVSTCGVGTKDNGTGTCVPDGDLVCTNGTIFDAASGTCQIDPSACQDGTVVIDHACVDPTAGLTVDAEEGPEPNGYGILNETSAAPAGTISIKASGTTVVHGKLVPIDRNGDGRLDPDIDTFLFSVNGPTYMHVTVAGLHGMAGGFALFPESPGTGTDPAALTTWQRFGITFSSDTASRDVFVPAAGTYAFSITDSRTLVSGPFAAGAESGQPAFEYYASISTMTLPAPTPLAFTGATASVAGALDPGEIKFYSLATTLGRDDATMLAPLAIKVDDAVAASVVILDGTKLFAVGTEHVETGVDAPAETIANGLVAATQLVVADTEFDWDLDATPFQLTITTSPTTP